MIAKIFDKRLFILYYMPLLFLLLISIISLRHVLIGEGVLFYRDFIYPFEDNFTTGVWNYSVSSPNLEMNKVPLNFIFSLGYYFFGYEYFIKLFQLFVMFMLGAVYYITALHWLNKANINIIDRAIAGIIPALFLMLNPWTIERISNHINFVFALALYPLVFTLIIAALRNSFSFSRVFYAAAGLTIISIISSHNIFYAVPIAFVLLPIVSAALHKSSRISTAYTNAFAIIILFVIFSSFWILPLLARQSSTAISPSYAFDISNIAVLSENSTALNVIGLNTGSGWNRIIPDASEMSFPGSLITVALFFLIALGMYLSREKKASNIVAIFLILFIALSLGTNLPLPIYELLLQTPLEPIVWLYRDPNRLLQFVVLMAAVFYTLLLVRTADLFSGSKKRFIMPVLLAILIFASPASSVMIGGDSPFQVSKVPDEYSRLSEYLKDNTTDGEKALWLPLRGYLFYDWNNSDEVAGNFYINSSPIPTYGLNTNAGIGANTLLNLYNNNFITGRTEGIDSLLSMYGIKHIVVHSDLEGWQQDEALRVAQKLDEHYGSPRKTFGPYAVYTLSGMAENFTGFHIGTRPGKYWYDAESYSISEASLMHYKPKGLSSTSQNSLIEWGRSKNKILWRADVNDDQQRYGFSKALDDITAASVDYEPSIFTILEIDIHPQASNNGREINIQLESKDQTYSLNRYDLENGTKNRLRFNLDWLKNQGFNIHDIERINFNIFRETSHGKYYDAGLQGFEVSRIAFTPYNQHYSFNALELARNIKSEEIHIAPVISFSDAEITISTESIPTESKHAFSIFHGESFDPSWVAEYVDIDGNTQTIKSKPAFGLINSYYINNINPGENITIYNTKDRHYRAGAYISVLSIIISVSYLVYSYKKI